jgi:hypothetical protein
MFRNGFDPAASYRVCTWRGFEHGTRQYKLDEVVTTAEIDATTLFTLYRFRFVEKVAGAVVAAKPPVQSVQPAAPAKPKSLAARVISMPLEELRRLCRVKGLDDSGKEADLRDRLLAVVG